MAVGDRVAALALPNLELLWQSKADDATCFGLYLTPDEQNVVVQGELTISKLTFDGQKQWSFGGKDIFTGVCAFREGAVLATDFNGQEYLIDLELGRGKTVGAG